MPSKQNNLIKCLIAYILVFASILSMIPTIDTAYAVTDVADGGGYGGGTGTGTFTMGASAGSTKYAQAGYRMYIIDRKTGEQLSNSVDFVFSNPTKKFSIGAIFTNSKLQDTGGAASKERSFSDKDMNKIYIISDVRDLLASQGNPLDGSDWMEVTPMSMDTPYKGKGADFRDWFTHNKTLDLLRK